MGIGDYGDANDGVGFGEKGEGVPALTFHLKNSKGIHADLHGWFLDCHEMQGYLAVHKLFDLP